MIIDFETLANTFRHFAETECRGSSALYEHLAHDFTAEAGGYANVEQDLTPEQRQALEATFCSLGPRALLDAVQVVLHVYQEMAPPLAAKHRAEYPAGVERVLSERLGRLVKKLASAAISPLAAPR